jgi:hypothetical protein
MVIALGGLSMLKLILLGPLWVLLGSTRGNRDAAEAAPAQVRCPRAPGGTPLFFKLKKPGNQHGRAVREILHEELPCLVFLCTRKGEMFAYVSKRDARKLLGRHVVYSSVKGAGNSADTGASFVEVRPASFVPESLKEHVERLTFNDDPMFDDTGPVARKCE